MAGLYFHVPFCRRRCCYCDFYFVTNDALIERFLVALEAEVVGRASLFESEIVSTIYFGGGTPSMLSGKQIERILSLVEKTFRLDSDLEITLEANPEDLSDEALREFSQAGVSRLSVGVQSFDERKLRALSREHSASQSRDGIERAHRWFRNVGLDLIFGAEGETLSDWRRDLETAIELSPEHVSAYSLTVEPLTPLAKLIARGKRQPPSDALQTEMFLQAIEILEASGYEHYEVSNYAKPNFRSRHNSSYWDRTPYLGFGPSAHSFFCENGDEIRTANARSLRRYLENPLASQDFRETLSDLDRFNELVLLSLRRREGLSLKQLRKSFNFAASHLNALAPTILNFQRDGLIATTDDATLKLTPKGFAVADSIAEAFFVSKRATLESDDGNPQRTLSKANGQP